MSCASACASFSSKSSQGRGVNVYLIASSVIGIAIFATVKHVPTLFLQALLCLSLYRCSFNRIVVTALDSDVSIISPTSNRYAYLMTCGHPCEPAGLVVLDMTPFMAVDDVREVLLFEV